MNAQAKGMVEGLSESMEKQCVIDSPKKNKSPRTGTAKVVFGSTMMAGWKQLLQHWMKSSSNTAKSTEALIGTLKEINSCVQGDVRSQSSKVAAFAMSSDTSFLQLILQLINIQDVATHIAKTSPRTSPKNSPNPADLKNSHNPADLKTAADWADLKTVADLGDIKRQDSTAIATADDMSGEGKFVLSARMVDGAGMVLLNILGCVERLPPEHFLYSDQVISRLLKMARCSLQLLSKKVVVHPKKDVEFEWICEMVTTSLWGLANLAADLTETDDRLWLGGAHTMALEAMVLLPNPIDTCPWLIRNMLPNRTKPLPNSAMTNAMTNSSTNFARRVVELFYEPKFVKASDEFTKEYVGFLRRLALYEMSQPEADRQASMFLQGSRGGIAGRLFELIWKYRSLSCEVENKLRETLEWALSTISSFISGHSDNIQILINNGLPMILQYFTSTVATCKHVHIREMALYAISNVACDGSLQFLNMLCCSGIFDDLLKFVVRYDWTSDQDATKLTWHARKSLAFIFAKYAVATDHPQTCIDNGGYDPLFILFPLLQQRRMTATEDADLTYAINTCMQAFEKYVKHHQSTNSTTPPKHLEIAKSFITPPNPTTQAPPTNPSNNMTDK